MELSIWTNYYHELSPNDALQTISESKFKTVELEGLTPFMNLDNPYPALDQTKQIAADLGINIHQLHGYWGGYFEPFTDDWKAGIDYFKKEILFAEHLGIKVIVAHPMRHSNLPEKRCVISKSERKTTFELNIRFFKELAPLLEKTGVKVGIENMPYYYGIFGIAEDLTELVDTINSPNIGITLDTSHLNMNRGNFSRFIHKVNKRLIATHISDNLQDDDRHLMPMFGKKEQGFVDWFQVRDALREINYQGTFNLEIPGATAAPIPIRKMKLNYIYDALTWLFEQE